MHPAADHIAVYVACKTVGGHLFLDAMKGGPAGIHHGIHVARGAHGVSQQVGHQQACHRAAHEHHLFA